MTQDDSKLIGLARKGDVQAIAALINRRTHPKGITTKVSINGDCLKLLLESQENPEQQVLASFARSLLMSLRIPGIYRVKLYGRKQGEEIPAWNTEFEIVEPALQTPQTVSKPAIASIKSSMPVGIATKTTKSSSKFSGSFQLSSSIPKTPEQQKISKSKACEYGIAGAVLGFIISLPSVWAAFQMLQLQGGSNFSMGYIIGIGVVVFIGYLSGFSQGLTQFEVNCPGCEHKFILSASGDNCLACNARLYLDDRGDCKVRL
jgi:hypothetical protein